MTESEPFARALERWEVRPQESIGITLHYEAKRPFEQGDRVHRDI